MTILFALALAAPTTMPAAPSLQTHLATPGALLGHFTERLNAGDLDALVALYLPEAVFTPEPGVVATGHDQIRTALAAMLALEPVIETTVEEMHVSGDTALAVVAWRMRGTAPDGSKVEQQGRSADVLVRQADGSWRIAIDHP